MKVLFLTADLGGNIPPTLAVAAALVRRGVAVEIAGLRPGRTGFAEVPFPAATAIKPAGRRQGWREAGAGARLMMGRATSTEAAALIGRRRADLVVVDCMIPAMIRGSVDSGVPAAVLFHTFGAFWRAFDRGPAGRLFGLRGLRPGALWDRAALRLLLTDAELDPGRHDPALAGWEWTGTTEHGAEPRSHDGDSARPRVLVALSSTEVPGMRAVYRRIVAALAGMPLEAIVTTGGIDLGGDVAPAANVEVTGWVDHSDLLPDVDLMVGHGGHSSTMKALAHGVPLLVLPVNPTADQRLIGRTVQSAGLGRRLPRTSAPAAIRRAVQDMLADETLRARASATGRRLRALPRGADVAAERIISVIDAHSPHED